MPGLCQGGRCINSVGSFSCECPPGQRRHPVSNNCEDIDECEDPDICPVNVLFTTISIIITAIVICS